MRASRRAMAGLGFVFVLAGCSGSGEEDQARPATTVPASTTTETSTSVPPVSIVEAPAPELRNTGEDFDAITRSIFAYRTWISRHPDPEAFETIYAEECACLETDQAKYVEYEANGWSWDDEGIQVLDVIEELRVSDDYVRLRVVTEHGPQRLVDTQGNMVDDGEGWAPYAQIFELARGANGRWKVALIEDLGYLEGSSG